MKLWFFALASLIFFGFSTTMHANCSKCHSIEVCKIYLQANQIAFDDSKIFVRLNNDVITVPAIFSDIQGYYILNEWGFGCKTWEWKCPNTKCGRCNALEYYNCPACGREMPD